MPVKNKSIWWRIGNSLWVILTLIPLFSWLAFFYIGLKVENKRYKTFGLIHLALTILLLVGGFTALGEISLMLMLLHINIMFIQSLVIRDSYLRQLAQREPNRRLEEALAQPKPAEQPSQAIAPERLNVNTCTEEALCTLPGIGIIEAKRMTTHRESRGDFSSVEEFITIIGIKPHVAVRIVDSLYAAPSDSAVVAKKPANRVLDI